jgi:cytochrome c556
MRGCLALLLGLGLLGVSLGRTGAQEAKGLVKAVFDLARESESGKDVDKKAAALKGAFKEVRAAMQVYNARTIGGVALGGKEVRLERRLIDLGEDGITAEELKKASAGLTRLAHLNLVVAEVTRGFAPEKPAFGRGKKQWERDVEAVKEASRELLKAVKADDPRAVQAAAARVSKACNSCHDGER